MWTIFDVFIEFVIMSFLFSVFGILVSEAWDLSFLTRDQTRTSTLEAQGLHHWVAKQVPGGLVKQFCPPFLPPTLAPSQFLT